MKEPKKLSTGKKFFYGLIIALCSLTILLSSVIIIGVWVVRQPLSDSAMAVLEVVQNSALAARRVEQRLDSTLARLETLSGEISSASEQLRQNINDKGLVMTLLPEEREQELARSVEEIQARIEDIRSSVTNAFEVYRSINRLPFVSLPGLSTEQIEQVSTTASKVQNLVETLRAEIANLRSGLAEGVDQVSRTVNQLTPELAQARTTLAQLDARLAALETLVVRLQKIIPTALLVIALSLTLFLAFVIYTQVEVISLYVKRWRKPGFDEAKEPGVITRASVAVEATEPLSPSNTNVNEEEN